MAKAEPSVRVGTTIGGVRMTDRIPVAFEGPGAGVGGLTWGQRKVWALMRAAGSSMVIGGVVPLTDGRTVEDLAAELRFLMSRYASLRARLRFGGGSGADGDGLGEGDGDPLQEVAGSGETELGILDVPEGEDPGRLAQDIAEHWDDTVFDYAREWPLRMAAVRRDGVATHVVVAISHLASDAGGVAVMTRELGERDPATGRARGPATAPGPLELAALQREPAARRQSDISLRHWESLLRTADPRLFGPPTDRGEPRYRRAVLFSPALDLAARAVATRTGDSASSVLLAAYAVAVARLTGVNPVLIQGVVGNRFRPGLAEVVHPVSVTGLLLLDVADASFDEAVDRTQRASIRASKYAYYDPAALDELCARVERERGEAVDLGCVFNLRRPELGPEPGGPPPPLREIDAALPRSTLSWGKPFPRFAEKLMLQAEHAGGAVELLLQLDTHYAAPHEAESLALLMEALVVEAAFDPGARTGVGPVPAAVRQAADEFRSGRRTL